uniref:Gfo/Idh/MocA-like oxidoreductase C-terminal domain-containing protein n=1 Tax=Romanomermis culicivorax TaxID=13658 RepID=A0A915I7S6_ROMCU
MRCYPFGDGDVHNEYLETSQTLSATVNVVIHCSPFVIVESPNDRMNYEINIYGSDGALNCSRGQLTVCGKNRETVRMDFLEDTAVDYHSHRTLLIACKHLHDKFIAQTKNVAESNNFSNDSYVRSVIDAIRKSNSNGDWVKVG